MIIRFLILLGVLSLNLFANHYPDYWWAPVPADQLYWWEISPHTAPQGSVVLSKRNELGILSNFAATEFVFHGQKFASLEGLWQSMKFPESENDERWGWGDWPYTRQQVEQMVGHEAKLAGDLASEKMKAFDANWVSFQGEKMDYRVREMGRHYQIIKAAMEEKLKQNEEVEKILKATGDLILLPDHHTTPEDPPAFRYYQIWMEIRSALN